MGVHVELRLISLDLLDRNESQPRTDFDDEALQALATSITEVGLLQPILARPVGERFEIVAGERRAKAARLAGLEEIPALVSDADEKQAFLYAVVENTGRSDLNPLEEAAAYQVLMDDLGIQQEAVAAKVGKSRQHIGNMLRLLRLPNSVQQMIAKGLLSAGHARVLVPVDDVFANYLLAKRVVDEGLSVRQLEEIVRAGRYHGATGRGQEQREQKQRQRIVNEELEDWLETRITDTKPSRGAPGSVNIQYADAEDKARIMVILLAAMRSTGSARGGAI